jgi:hypothetical protein
MILYVVQDVVKWMYLHNIESPVSKVNDLLAAAEYFQIAGKYSLKIGFRCMPVQCETLEILHFTQFTFNKFLRK